MSEFQPEAVDAHDDFEFGYGSGDNKNDVELSLKIMAVGVEK
jgi:hypothetical protein